MFFNGFEALYRVVIVSALAYASLVLILRVAGKRSLSKLNAFDLAVTVAFGSTLATVLLSKDVALSEGALAFAMLAILQYAVSALSVRSGTVKKFVRSEPRILCRDGRFLEEALREERVTESELDAAIRKEGIGRIEEVAVAVLETDGSFSIIRKGGDGPMTALRFVRED